MSERKFDFRGPFMMERNPNAIGNQILPLKCSFDIGYGISQKYLPIWVSVSDQNQNSGFSRTLYTIKSEVVDWSTIQFLIIYGVLLSKKCYYQDLLLLPCPAKRLYEFISIFINYKEADASRLMDQSYQGPYFNYVGTFCRKQANASMLTQAS